MKTMRRPGAADVLVIGFEPGEMLLESVQRAIDEHGVRNGAVVSGIGTLKTCTLHCIEHTNFPSDNHFFTLEKPLELLSVSGVIADGEPHLHVVVSCGESEVHAGHLEPGSEVAYLAELVVLAFNDLPLTRRLDERRQIKLLGPKD